MPTSARVRLGPQPLQDRLESTGLGEALSSRREFAHLLVFFASGVGTGEKWLRGFSPTLAELAELPVEQIVMTAWPQPLIVVRDVAASSRFYAQILDAESAHGGEEYDQLVSGGELILQFHQLDVAHHHGPLASRDIPLGNGALIWFEVSDFDAAVARARAAEAVVEREVHVNPNANQQEIWLRDPDGYLLVLAGPSEHRPRPSA